MRPGQREVERRFLVQDPVAAIGGAPGVEFIQGYLCRDPHRVVRVRLAVDPQGGEEAWLTVKGAPEPDHGATLCRKEWELPLEPGLAREWLELCRPCTLEKCRHTVEHHGRTWVVDVFHGMNEGLVLAEVELEDPEVPLHLPPWLGAEVGADPRYHNSALAETPTSRWPTSASGSFD
jgi:adenylate cyclase